MFGFRMGKNKQLILSKSVCSLAVQWKILQCEEVLTALFAPETQLEWDCSSPLPLIISPFLYPLGFSPRLSFPACSSRPPVYAEQPTAGEEGIREGTPIEP
ncbi:hypothetical protein AMECASPLE_004015 [Ameca splendens]|uniref:Uncharacterized protein n=1 Tax=Ameca splendens TaxID=208324 RepID=A0ABV0ZVK7_9TELE